MTRSTPDRIPQMTHAFAFRGYSSAQPEAHLTARSLFVHVARLEGISLLLLFFVAMPLKYGAGFQHATMVPGWIHGVLFMAYVGMLLWVSAAERWPVVLSAGAFIASFLPFGTFLLERRLPEPPAADAVTGG